MCPRRTRIGAHECQWLNERGEIGGGLGTATSGVGSRFGWGVGGTRGWRHVLEWGCAAESGARLLGNVSVKHVENELGFFSSKQICYVEGCIVC